jgi:hypothetical protein
MDQSRSDNDQSPAQTGVDGLGFAGRGDRDDAPSPSDGGVPGLGFGGRPRPDEFDGDRFVSFPDPDGDDDTTEPDVDEPEDVIP